MSDDEAVWDDDDKLVSILDVLKAVGLFGELIVQPVQTIDDDEFDYEAELEYQDTVVSKFSGDYDSFPFQDRMHGVETRGGVQDVRPEREPSGHEWVASQAVRGTRTEMTVINPRSDCGKPLSQCYSFKCNHENDGLEFKQVPDIRHEYKEEWTSLSDRPTENSWIGLPGLRDIEAGDYRWYRWNSVCPECHIMTPKAYKECQYCDAVVAV